MLTVKCMFSKRSAHMDGQSTGHSQYQGYPYHERVDCHQS